eukprot:1097702-Pleurochrysis_carterae.AAC.7
MQCLQKLVPLYRVSAAVILKTSSELPRKRTEKASISVASTPFKKRAYRAALHACESRETTGHTLLIKLDRFCISAVLVETAAALRFLQWHDLCSGVYLLSKYVLSGNEQLACHARSLWDDHEACYALRTSSPFVSVVGCTDSGRKMSRAGQSMLCA